jgi:phospholipid transport system substrate-binding protein
MPVLTTGSRTDVKSLLASICILLLATAGIAVADDSPNAVIDSAVAQLTEQLDGRKDELAENRQALYEIIDDILLPRFDSRFAAQLVLARHWRTASEEQQSRFIDAFYQALLRKYADGVLEFDPDMITVLPFRGDPTKKRAKVRSTVDLEDGTKVAVDYELVQRKSGWLVFNVIIEGVSYVRNFRAELDSEIKASGLDAVIARLESEAGSVADE